MPPADPTKAPSFFIDRSLGSGVIATALRDAGESVVTHDSMFRPDTPDVVWLAEAGKAGLVVLTKDARIRTNELERRALLDAKVAAFMLGRGDLRAKEMAEAFLKAMPRMKKALRRWRRPLIAAVTVDGKVTVLFADGAKLARPHPVK